MFGGLFVRNLGYAVKHPKRTWAVRKACKNHVKREPMCQWCGGVKRCQAHHVVPLWADDTLGADPDNFITLCQDRRCHLLIGHNGDFARRYVRNVRNICETRKIVNRK